MEVNPEEIELAEANPEEIELAEEGSDAGIPVAGGNPEEIDIDQQDLGETGEENGANGS